ncbi:MAG: ABC-F family ATP-binding cassette domain-containing protein [Gemmatimonadota bacterium]|nr:ABC-F family ATP-binding cassette domain-containing protein [Gemmatimonadota bacterium]
MITISNLAKTYGDQTLFRGVSLQLNDGERYGLVGANGSGKSTFLKILAGEVPPSDGSVTIPRRARVGVLRQDHFEYEGVRILDVVMMGHAELWRAMKEKEEVLAEAADGEFDADRFAEAEETVQRLDGYTMESRAGQILEGLGIPTPLHEEPLSVLSGGFKLRVLLAQTLAASPDVLLLDEPTNHLDIVSIRWLETFLSEFEGCLVTISHDHRFLDNVSTAILDVDYRTIQLYPGNYEYFEEAKVAERERREAEIAKREREIADLQRFVDRFRAKASKARQAQSKLKQIERREAEIEPLPESSRRWPTFRFRQRRASGKVALELDGIGKSFGDNRVLSDVSLEVKRGDRLAVIGPNGIGKSTLLKIAMGRLEPDEGEIEWGYETYPGYFAQDHRNQLEAGLTAEEWLWRACPGEGKGFVRGHLGMVLISGDEAKKRVEALSGGEAARLVFARLSIDEPNVLVLDEPTNHLDLESIEALVDGLEAFDGTIVFVSHDRWFVRRVATRILELTPEGARDFEGDWDAYVRWVGDDHLDATDGRIDVKPSRASTGAGSARDGRPGDDGTSGTGNAGSGKAKRPGSAERARAKRVAELEEERERLLERIEAAEAELEALRERFADPELYEEESADALAELRGEEREASRRVESLMGEWNALEAELERESARV